MLKYPLSCLAKSIYKSIIEQFALHLISLAGIVDAVFRQESVGNPSGRRTGASGDVIPVVDGDIVLAAVIKDDIAGQCYISFTLYAP